MRQGFIIGGALLMLIGLTSLIGIASSMGSGSMPNPAGGFIFVLFFGAGGFLLKLGLVKPVADYVANETQDAVRTAAGAARSGWGEAKEVVRLKCRACGFLDDEHAKYCSGCGEAM